MLPLLRFDAQDNDRDNDIAKSISDRGNPGPLDCFAEPVIGRASRDQLARHDVEIFFPQPPSGDLPCLKADARAAGLVLFARNTASPRKKAAGVDARIG
jgi:hypothetical protein